MKRKRLLALLLTGVMMMTLLAGCGGSGEEEAAKEADANGDKTTITVSYTHLQTNKTAPEAKVYFG